MTAIAITFNSDKDEFVIAADGRCAVYTANDIEVVSDTAQKIFAFESADVRIAYALTGISAIGSFQLIPEIKTQLETTASRGIANGSQYAYRVFSNVVRNLDKAKGDGRIPAVLPCALIPAEEGTKKFAAFLFGYFRSERFSTQGDFHYDDRSGRFNVQPYHTKLLQNQVWHTGSRIIGRMLFNPGTPIDPRVAHYKNDPDNARDALEVAASFVKACSLPAATEIDPQCRLSGGHLHAARVSRHGFQWLIPPATHS